VARRSSALGRNGPRGLADIRNVKVSKTRLNEVMRAAKAAAKNGELEVCGLLVLNGEFLDLVPTRNAERRPGKFNFFASDLRRVSSAASVLGYQLVGSYHSHPLGLPEPSPADLAHAQGNSFMLILDCFGSEAKLWFILRRIPHRVRIKLI